MPLLFTRWWLLQKVVSLLKTKQTCQYCEDTGDLRPTNLKSLTFYMDKIQRNEVANQLLPPILFIVCKLSAKCLLNKYIFLLHHLCLCLILFLVSVLGSSIICINTGYWSNSLWLEIVFKLIWSFKSLIPFLVYFTSFFFLVLRVP